MGITHTLKTEQRRTAGGVSHHEGKENA